MNGTELAERVGHLKPDGFEADAHKSRKRFFLKKEAKTFAHKHAIRARPNAKLAKVFWFFFSKKNCLLDPCQKRETRVLLVAPYAPGGGGMGRMMAYLADAVPAAPGFTFESVESRGGGSAAMSAVHTLRAAARIVRAAWSPDPVIVHVNVAEGLSVLRKGLLLGVARLVGLPVALHLHAAQIISFHDRLSWPGRALMRVMFQSCTVCIVLGTLWRDWLIDVLGVEARRIEIVPNGVPDPHVDRPIARRLQFRFVFIGNILPRKGLSDLLESLADICLASLDWELVVAGGGDNARLAEHAHDLGIGARVSFAGWLARNDTTRLLSTADALVLPSYYEAMPLVVLEALSLGVPVITTPVGAIPDVLTNGENALLVAPGDRAALSQAAFRLITDDELASGLGRAGRALYERAFTMERFTNALHAVYLRHCCAAKDVVVPS